MGRSATYKFDWKTDKNPYKYMKSVGFTEEIPTNEIINVHEQGFIRHIGNVDINSDFIEVFNVKTSERYLGYGDSPHKWRRYFKKPKWSYILEVLDDI